MEYEKQIIWIIPNGEYQDKGLEDGQCICFPHEVGDENTHLLKCNGFCEEHNLSNYPVGGSHGDWGNYFAKKGIAIVFNSGVMAGGKYFIGGIYLPSQLTEKQIKFFEDRKELFYEKYYLEPTFFGVRILSDEIIPYRNDGFRDLVIEAKINNQPSDNGIDLFYQELERQKENLPKKHI